MLNMNITYELDQSLYINLTNLCSNNCSFCIRNNSDGVGSADSLWLAREPSGDEVVEAILKNDLHKYKQLVFCGFGEPLERLDTVIYVCSKIKAVSEIPIRINTNGQSDLINGKPTANLLKGLVDEISISLNAPDAAAYDRICASEFGEKAFEAILKFAADCAKVIPQVTFSVVDVLPRGDIEKSRKIAESVGVGFRVRKMID